MNNKQILGEGLIILIITLGAFLVLPGLIFSDGQGKYTRPYIPGIDTTNIEPKQEIRQFFECKWDLPVDSCDGWERYL